MVKLRFSSPSVKVTSKANSVYYVSVPTKLDVYTVQLLSLAKRTFCHSMLDATVPSTLSLIEDNDFLFLTV